MLSGFRTLTSKILASAAALALAMMVLHVPPAEAEFTAKTVMTTENADYFGFDLRTEKNVTLDQCKATCLGDSACRAFTYASKAKWCFLKSDFALTNEAPGAIAGRVVPVSGEDLGAPPALSFLTDYQKSEAQKYRERMDKSLDRYKARGVGQLIADGRLAYQEGRFAQASDLLYGSLVLDRDVAQIWSELAQSLRQFPPDNNTNVYRLRQVSLSAAINAYQLARTTGDRATALTVLAETLEFGEQYRPALEAYKASLALKPDEEVQAAFEELRSTKGFRVIEHTVDADGAVPRACLQLSEALVKSGVDYAQFIRMNGTEPQSFVASGKQVCVDGLKHGERYTITLREGLPSIVGEVLEKAVEISVYVRDRSPYARFSGEAFVLPARGRQGIPVVSVNTETVGLSLYRVGDRAISRLLEGEQFLTQLSGYGADELARTQGELVWKGELETERQLNTEVTTSFPVDEALPQRKPGVYVLVADANKGEDGEDDWTDRATQWFVVSDIGLFTQTGNDGLTVFTRSLDSAKPLSGVAVKLVARNNELLGEAISDAEGTVRFDAGLTRGRAGLAPAAVLAQSTDAGFVFLDMTKAAFDLSDRGVEGREAPGAIDVFAFTERGIYRAGETVHAVALARTDEAVAVDALPLTFVFRRPDGVEHSRSVSAAPRAGGHVVDMALPGNAMRGAWTLRIHADPKGDALSEKTFLVEDFVPDRIEFDLSAGETPVLDPENGGAVTVNGRFLYGAPAAGLALEAEMKVTAVRTRPGFDGYVFGLADKDEDGSTSIPLDGLPVLDDKGKAVIPLDAGRLPATTKPQQASVVVRLREGAGRAVERSIDLPVKPGALMIGVKPDFEGEQAGEGSTPVFSVIAVTPDGKTADLAGLSWELVKVERNYQWYREDSSWRYEAVDFTKREASGTVDAKATGPVTIATPVNWGRYRLELKESEEGGAATSIEFNAGWYVETASLDTPDGLDVALDKASYMPGEVARLKVSPRFAGELLVTIGSDRLLATHTASIPAEGGEIDIPVGEDWGAGAYVTATLYRPGSAAESRMPSRALGLKWLAVDSSARTLDVALDTVAQGKPGMPLDIGLAVKGVAPGEEAYVTVAAIDVGILNLTSYQPPKPQEWYYGQRRMGLQLRDMYGRLIDGSPGSTGRLRTGGDAPGAESKGSAPKGRLVAFFSGPVQLDAEGRANVSFDIPQFNGTVRIMAVAWSKSALGSATKDVILRDPVVVLAGLPRFLAVGDNAQMHLDIANTDGPAGAYSITLTPSGAVEVPAGRESASVTLEKGARTTLTMPISAKAPGVAGLVLRIAHAEGLEVTQDLSFPVRPGALPMTTRREITLAANGGSLKLDSGLLQGNLLADASVTVNVSKSSAFDIPALLMNLDRYPYGCAEQTTSRALPLLYLSELAEQAGLPPEPQVTERISKAITRVLAYQSSSGSFGLWSPGSGDLWLDAYVTDFLTRAAEKGFEVPAIGMQLALQNLENELAYTTDVSDAGREIAYALYVLARNRKASAGDLRYYADQQLEAFDSPLSRAHLAASLALYSDGNRSQSVFASALALAGEEDAEGSRNRSDYGSRLRDGAALLALAAEAKPQPANLAGMIGFVEKRRAERRYSSTQEDAWMLLAARALSGANDTIALEVNGTAHKGAFSVRKSGAEIESEALTVANRTDKPLTAVLTSIAAPSEPLPAGGEGFAIERVYYTLDGKPASVTDVTQNSRLVAVLTIRETNDWPSRIVVTDLLPAGFEIDNPSLTGSAQLKNFSWLAKVEPAHLEFLDDRFVAAFTRSGSEDRQIQLAYVVRAVTPGTFVHPAAQVEDMYRPEFSARTASGFLTVTAAK